MLVTYLDDTYADKTLLLAFEKIYPIVRDLHKKIISDERFKGETDKYVALQMAYLPLWWILLKQFELERFGEFTVSEKIRKCFACNNINIEDFLQLLDAEEVRIELIGISVMAVTTTFISGTEGAIKYITTRRGQFTQPSFNAKNVLDFLSGRTNSNQISTIDALNNTWLQNPEIREVKYCQFLNEDNMFDFVKPIYALATTTEFISTNNDDLFVIE